MKIKYFEPNFRTKDEDLAPEERNKAASHGTRGNLYHDLREERPDVAWESEQLAKSYGIYLEFNRARTGKEKDWVYMIRISIPGGGPIAREQWHVLDELAERFTGHSANPPSLRITTRQNLQFHWIKKEHLIEVVRTVAENGLYSLNGCGDNVRNIMACPLASYSKLFDGNALAKKLANFFRLPAEPFIQIFAIDPNLIREDGKKFKYGAKLLNRKFKIGISSHIRDPKSGHLVPDNCVELRTHDMGIAPVVHNEKLQGFEVYIGGGQGEKNGKPTLSAFSKPFAAVSEEDLLPVLDGIVQVHQDWGDRQNRHWARLKYVVKAKGISWFREQVEARTGITLGEPDPSHDLGDRFLHHGWLDHPDPELLNFGAFIENGRIADTESNGRLKTMVREIMNRYPVQVRFTPNQDLIFSDIPADAKEEFEVELRSFGFGARNGSPYSRLRLVSGACVGLDTCRMAYTDSEKIEPLLIDELEKLGWADMAESIGVTGCERQCFRPATKTIGLIGSGRKHYQFKLMGSESSRFQGVPLLSEDGSAVYLRKVPRERVVGVIDTLFRFYMDNRLPEEDMGAFHRRVGHQGLIEHLQATPATADVMKPELVRTSMDSPNETPEPELVPA